MLPFSFGGVFGILKSREGVVGVRLPWGLGRRVVVEAERLVRAGMVRKSRVGFSGGTRFSSLCTSAGENTTGTGVRKRAFEGMELTCRPGGLEEGKAVGFEAGRIKAAGVVTGKNAGVEEGNEGWNVVGNTEGAEVGKEPEGSEVRKFEGVVVRNTEGFWPGKFCGTEGSSLLGKAEETELGKAEEGFRDVKNGLVVGKL